MEKEKKILINRRLIKIIIPIALVLIIIACGIISIVVQNSKYNEELYQSANKLYKNENYKQSIKKYKELNLYKDSKKKLSNSYYLYGKSLIQQKKYEESLKILDNCNNTKKCRELIKESQYQIAISNIDINDESALKVLNKINPYKESQKYIDDYNYKHRFDGTYKHNGEMVIIKQTSNNKITYYFNDGHYNTGIELDCNNEYSICEKTITNFKLIFEFKDSYLIEKTRYSETEKNSGIDLYKDSDDTFEKVSNSIKLPKEKKYYDPEIGMTIEEVLNSTWGTPDDKNKSTYSWGTTEQWIYENKNDETSYIYFEDGIVTSISE